MLMTMIYIHNGVIFYNQTYQMTPKKKGKKTLSYLDLSEHPTRNCRKNQYDNTKGCQKFGMATYMKDIVTIK